MCRNDSPIRSVNWLSGLLGFQYSVVHVCSFQKGGIEFAALRLFLFPAVPVSGRMVMDNNALSGFIALATVELPFSMVAVFI